MGWVKTASTAQLQRRLTNHPTVVEGVRTVTVRLEATTRELTYGRAVETGQLAQSWKTVRTRQGWRVESDLPSAVFIEGGTGKTETTKRGTFRVVRPRTARMLRFPAPTSWADTPPGTIMYRRWVKGVTPQHVLRDAGRSTGTLTGVRWNESAHPINQATETRGY